MNDRNDIYVLGLFLYLQMMVVLVDKLLKTQIIEPSAVANWLFSSEMQPEFTK